MDLFYLKFRLKISIRLKNHIKIMGKIKFCRIDTYQNIYGLGNNGQNTIKLPPPHCFYIVFITVINKRDWYFMFFFLRISKIFTKPNIG